MIEEKKQETEAGIADSAEENMNAPQHRISALGIVTILAVVYGIIVAVALFPSMGIISRNNRLQRNMPESSSPSPEETETIETSGSEEETDEDETTEDETEGEENETESESDVNTPESPTPTPTPTEGPTVTPTPSAAPTASPTPEPDSELMVQYLEKKGEVDRTINEICSAKKLPAVVLTTKDDATLTLQDVNNYLQEKEIYTETMVDVCNAGEEYRMTAEAEVKMRGNSSLTDNPKEPPLRIRFKEKQNMLGLHSGKKFRSWVLLRPGYTMIGDYTAYTLAKEILDGYYSTDCQYVNLYVNGQNRGVFILCEQNQATKNRVEIVEASDELAPDEIGYFLELDNYSSQEPYHFTMDYEKAMVKDFTGKEQVFWSDGYSVKNLTNDEQLAFVERYTKNLFHLLLEATERNNLLMFDENYELVSAEGVYQTAEEAIEAAFDIDSVVDMYLLEEIMCNYDLGNGSFYMAVDFSEHSRYPKMTFLAPWDFGWTCFYQESEYYAGTFQQCSNGAGAPWDCSLNWFVLLAKQDWFRDRVNRRWQELNSEGQLQGVVSGIIQELDYLAPDLPEAGREKKINSGKINSEWVLRRIKWMDSVYVVTPETEAEGTATESELIQ